MSDSSGANVDFSPTDFIIGLASIYVLFNWSAFLGWAAGLGAPFAGLAKIVIYLLIIVGAVETLIIAILCIALVIVVAVGLFKGVMWVINR